eukprot:g3074.t1
MFDVRHEDGADLIVDSHLWQEDFFVEHKRLLKMLKGRCFPMALRRFIWRKHVLNRDHYSQVVTKLRKELRLTINFDENSFHSPINNLLHKNVQEYYRETLFTYVRRPVDHIAEKLTKQVKISGWKERMGGARNFVRRVTQASVKGGTGVRGRANKSDSSEKGPALSFESVVRSAAFRNIPDSKASYTNSQFEERTVNILNCYYLYNGSHHSSLPPLLLPFLIVFANKTFGSTLGLLPKFPKDREKKSSEDKKSEEWNQAVLNSVTQELAIMISVFETALLKVLPGGGARREKVGDIAGRVWDNLKAANEGLFKHIDRIFEARTNRFLRAKKTLSSASGIVHPWELFLHWCEVCFVGYLKSHALFYVWDQCFLLGWNEQFHLFCLDVLNLIEPELLEAGAIPDLQRIIRESPKNILTHQLRSAFLDRENIAVSDKRKEQKKASKKVDDSVIVKAHLDGNINDVEYFKADGFYGAHEVLWWNHQMTLNDITIQAGHFNIFSASITEENSEKRDVQLSMIFSLIAGSIWTEEFHRSLGTSQATHYIHEFMEKHMTGKIAQPFSTLFSTMFLSKHYIILDHLLTLNNHEDNTKVKCKKDIYGPLGGKVLVKKGTSLLRAARKASNDINSRLGKSTALVDLIEAQMGKPASRKAEDISKELRSYCVSDRKHVPKIRLQLKALLEKIQREKMQHLYNKMDISVMNGSQPMAKVYPTDKSKRDAVFQFATPLLLCALYGNDEIFELLLQQTESDLKIGLYGPLSFPVCTCFGLLDEIQADTIVARAQIQAIGSYIKILLLLSKKLAKDNELILVLNVLHADMRFGILHIAYYIVGTFVFFIQCKKRTDLMPELFNFFSLVMETFVTKNNVVEDVAGRDPRDYLVMAARTRYQEYSLGKDELLFWDGLQYAVVKNQSRSGSSDSGLDSFTDYYFFVPHVIAVFHRDGNIYLEIPEFLSKVDGVFNLTDLILKHPANVKRVEAEMKKFDMTYDDINGYLVRILKSIATKQKSISSVIREDTNDPHVTFEDLDGLAPNIKKMKVKVLVDGDKVALAKARVVTMVNRLCAVDKTCKMPNQAAVDRMIRKLLEESENNGFVRAVEDMVDDNSSKVEKVKTNSKILHKVTQDDTGKEDDSGTTGPETNTMEKADESQGDAPPASTEKEEKKKEDVIPKIKPETPEKKKKKKRGWFW